MSKLSRLTLVAFTLALIPLCMGASCSTDIRDAAYGGLLDYVSGTTTDATESFVPLSTALANLFAGPSGAQDQ